MMPTVRMWHSQCTSVRCVCCLPVGRPTLRLLVRSHGGRGADALGSRRISTSSERTGRLAHQPVVCPGDSEHQPRCGRHLVCLGMLAVSSCSPYPSQIGCRQLAVRDAQPYLAHLGGYQPSEVVAEAAVEAEVDARGR